MKKALLCCLVFDLLLIAILVAVFGPTKGAVVFVIASIFAAVIGQQLVKRS